MHEWGLANDLVRHLESEGRSRGADRILRVKLRIGSLSGVSVEAFRFAFEAAAAPSIVATDALEIEEVAGESACRSCGAGFADPDGLALCPVCGEANKTPTRGREMDTVSFEMEIDDV